MDRSSLEDLFAVQDLDTKMRDCRLSLERLNATSGAAELQSSLRALEDERVGLAKSLEGLSQERDLLEASTSSLMAKVKKMKSQESSGAISHRDLQSAETEIVSLEGQRSELEDRELEILSKVEDTEDKLRRIEAVLLERKLQMNALRKANSGVAHEIQSQIDAWIQLRREAAEKVDPKLLKAYESIFAKLGTKAIARIENSVCEGCRMKLSALEVESVRKTLSNEFSVPPTCEQCGRILYV